MHTTLGEQPLGRRQQGVPRGTDLFGSSDAARRHSISTWFRAFAHILNQPVDSIQDFSNPP
ncbi:hypothetical protein [Streptomyces sp. 4F14]|uniref:hypothetical protein n=1 Tax=Streptomyces sp. 4F14 TaxID=3394380 RepID=UPI003A85D697